MKKMRILAAVVALALASSPAFAQNAAPDAATRSLLASCDALVTQGKYLSAYKLLEGAKDQNDFVLAREIEICIRYFAQSIAHRMFGLVDLKPGESLEKLRGSTGTFTMVALDPEEAAKTYLATHPKSAVLFKALGDYYYDLLLRYPGSSLEGDDVAVKRAVENYEAALGTGSLDAGSLGNYAEMLIRAEQFAKAVTILDKAIKADPSNGNLQYNLAYACLQNKDFPRAISAARAAMGLYKDNPEYLVDTYFLALDASRASGDLSGAFNWLAIAAKASPGDYRIPSKGMTLSLMKGDTAAAAKNADALFAMAPTNPSAPQMIMDAYYGASKKAELATFFESALQKYKGNDEALGNLLFHYSQLAHETRDDAKARALLDQAALHFKKVMKPDDKVFKAIDAQRKAYGG